MKHTSGSSPSRRTRQLARIHALARDLDLTESAYRNTLAALTGHRSAADLDEAGRLRVIAFMAGELSKRNPDPTTPAPIAVLPTETVTDDEALEILGLAA